MINGEVKNEKVKEMFEEIPCLFRQSHLPKSKQLQNNGKFQNEFCVFK
jgi:hypothetical protein